MKNYSLDQYNEVLANISGFLPQALKDTDPEKIMAILTQKDEKLQSAFTKSLSEYLLSQSQVAEQSFNSSFTIVQLGAFPLDYDINVSKAIKPGKYQWKDDSINQRNFPRKRSGKANVAINLFHFGRNMSQEAVLKAMDKVGYRPAELLELLAIGASPEYRDLQKEFPIIALGSVWLDSDGSRYAPGLHWDGSMQYLNLFWLDYDWAVPCRFAGVRK